MFMSKTRGQLCSARVERAGMQAIWDWESTTEVLYEAVALSTELLGGWRKRAAVSAADGKDKLETSWAAR
jgi:hypothetical protein